MEAVPGVKKVFIRSGIRFDYLMYDKDGAFFEKLVRDHVSGQLKVAPEHCSDAVLDAMGKPHFEVYEAFRRRFFELTKKVGKEQYLVPYLMSSHPGSRLSDAVTLAECLKRDHYAPEQVQDFYPTPGTASTVMYYTGINPLTMKPVYVATDYREKQEQRALLQFTRPQNAAAVRAALTAAGRTDLIGTRPECLVRPAGDRSGQKGNDRFGKGPGPKESHRENAGGKTLRFGGKKKGAFAPSNAGGKKGAALNAQNSRKAPDFRKTESRRAPAGKGAAGSKKR